MSSPGVFVNKVDRLVVWLVYAQHKRVVGKLAGYLLKIVGVDIPPRVGVGAGLRLPHGTTGLVVNAITTLGSNVTLFHGVTCARSDTWMPYNPDTTILVGDGVIVAPNSTILVPGGETRVIGDRAIIGANSVVTDDVPAGEIWAGSPARYIRDRRDDE